MEGRWDEESPSVLSDDDQQRGDRPRKRPRVDRDALETLVRSSASRAPPRRVAYHGTLRSYCMPMQLQEGGCTLKTGNINEESTVQDVRRLRRVLGSRLLLDVNLRTEVLQDLGLMLREPETLRHLLLPLVPETQVMRGIRATICLASLIGRRVIPLVRSDISAPLTTRPRMQDGNATGDSLMRILLTTDVIQAYVAEQLLVKLADDDVEQSLASLILSQFRW